MRTAGREGVRAGRELQPTFLERAGAQRALASEAIAKEAALEASKSSVLRLGLGSFPEEKRSEREEVASAVVTVAEQTKRSTRSS